MRCYKNCWIYLTSTYVLLVTFATNDNYSIRFEISNNSSTIQFDSIWNEKNTVRTALMLTMPEHSMLTPRSTEQKIKLLLCVVLSRYVVRYLYTTDLHISQFCYCLLFVFFGRRLTGIKGDHLLVKVAAEFHVLHFRLLECPEFPKRFHKSVYAVDSKCTAHPMAFIQCSKITSNGRTEIYIHKPVDD